MVERLVLVKLDNANATPDGRREIADYSERVLADVPGVKEVHVCAPADDRTAASWDLALKVRFDRVEDIEPYLAHPAHRAYVDEYLSPKMVTIRGWNFTAP